MIAGSTGPLMALRLPRRWAIAITVAVIAAAGLMLAICVRLGGVRTAQAVYTSWRDPGSLAFGDRLARPGPPAPMHTAVVGSEAPLLWWRSSAKWWSASVAEPAPAPGEGAFIDKDRMYVLVLGLDYNHDARGILYTRNARTDTIMVAALDRRARGLTLLSIPRDMRVRIPGYGMDKINAAYALRPRGAPELSVRTVEAFLGIHVDHVVIVKPYAAEHLVDALGGLTLDVEKRMDYDDTWGGLHIHLKKGRQHLNGRQAVGYIRFRHDEEGDRGRVRRQQQFLSALLGQVKRLDILKRIPDLQRAFEQDIETTFSYEQLVDLAMLYRDFDRRKLRGISLSGEDASIGGGYYMIPDERQKRSAVARLRRRS